MLAQGKTMASGAASAGQSIEFTIIPYGNGVAFDADSNVRESTSDYTIYTDGFNEFKKTLHKAELTKGDSGNPSLTVSINNQRPKSILAFSYDSISLINFASNESTGSVQSVYGTNIIAYDTTTHKITINRTNRHAVFIFSNEIKLIE